MLTEPNVSRQHARITVTAAGTEITPLPSVNGTGVDGVALPIGQTAPVRSGQLIAAGHDLLTVTPATEGDTIAIEADPREPFFFSVNRPPRTPHAVPAPVVVDFGGGQPAVREQSQPWVALLVAPAMAAAVGVLIAWFTHQWVFLLFSVAGVAGTLGTQLYSRRSGRVKARQAGLTAHDAATAGRERLATAIEAEERMLRDALPDPGQLLRIATGPGTRLWERRPRDDDFLRLRAGTGDLPASMVTVRGVPVADGADPRGAAIPGPGRHGAGNHGLGDNGPGAEGLAAGPIVGDVPVPVNLTALGVLGIAGPAEASLPALAWMVAQIAALHGPSHVRLVLLTDQPGAWRWARWLPHLRPLDDRPGRLSVGGDPTSVAELVASLRDLIGRRLATIAGQPGLPSPRGSYPRGGFGLRAADSPSGLPVVVVILDGTYRLRREADLTALMADGPAAGVYVICRDDDWRALPGDCRGLLHADPARGGTGSYREPGREVTVTRLDKVTGQWADQVARALAPIRDVPATRSLAAGLPQSIRLLDLWGIGQPDAADVAALWRQGGRATVVPVGEATSGMFTLDLVHDGPHFLLGGFTGSGKSEFLRTLVASLILGNTPDELTFALIDYKGGAGFAKFEPLPHVTGYLTDLDEYGGARALAALGAEIRYRLSLLNKAGCDSIGDYIAAGKPLGPLPRLVLVIDEFRYLAEQMPEFLPGLIDVAARGRSVGMHLVLATQRPNGVVKQDLLANIGLRLCLHVQDPADSIAVVDIPDAATISKDQRGRGYARSGHGIAVPFQAGYVGGTAPASAPGGGQGPVRARVWPFGIAVSSSALPVPNAPSAGPTDLDSIVRGARDAGWQRPSRLAWLAPLPELIPARDLPGTRPSPGGLPPVAYGMEDLPSTQAQRVLAFDLEQDTHLLVGGAPQSGRTTTLRTIAARIAITCSPCDVHLYVLDCGAGGLSALAGLPHCGAVVRPADKERAARLLDRLAAEVARRRELLEAGGFDSVTEQRARSRERLPYMVLLLDRLEGFAEDLGDYDGGRLPGVLARLLSEGASAGLRIIATGDKASLTRQASSYPARLVLRLSDPGDYMTAGLARGAMPAKPCEGRGVLLPAGTAVQVAFASPDTLGGGQGLSGSPGAGTTILDASGAAQAQALDAVIRAAREASPMPSPAPLRVAPLPGRISLAEARTLPLSCRAMSSRAKLLRAKSAATSPPQTGSCGRRSGSAGTTWPS